MPETPNARHVVEEHAGAALMALICVLALAQVAARYVLGQSLGWSEELVRYMFVAMTFLAFSGNVARREHLSVHLLPASVPRRALAIAEAAAIALFAGLVAYAGVVAIIAQYTSGHTTPALEWPRWAVTAIVPVMCAAALVRAASILMRTLVHRPEQETNRPC